MKNMILQRYDKLYEYWVWLSRNGLYDLAKAAGDELDKIRKTDAYKMEEERNKNGRCD